jgi:hypothetical protein
MNRVLKQVLVGERSSHKKAQKAQMIFGALLVPFALFRGQV